MGRPLTGSTDGGGRCRVVQAVERALLLALEFGRREQAALAQDVEPHELDVEIGRIGLAGGRDDDVGERGPLALRLFGGAATISNAVHSILFMVAPC